MNSFQLTELVFLLHRNGPDEILLMMADDIDLYAAPGAEFKSGDNYFSQAEIAFLGFTGRKDILLGKPISDKVFLQILRILAKQNNFSLEIFDFPLMILEEAKNKIPYDEKNWEEFASLARLLVSQLSKQAIREISKPKRRTIDTLNLWADVLEKAMAYSKKLSTN